MFLVTVTLVRQGEKGIERVSEMKVFKPHSTLEDIKKWIINKSGNPQVVLRNVTIDEPEVEGDVVPIKQ